MTRSMTRNRFGLAADPNWGLLWVDGATAFPAIVLGGYRVLAPAGWRRIGGAARG
jgi:hypothetical protein